MKTTGLRMTSATLLSSKLLTRALIPFGFLCFYSCATPEKILLLKDTGDYSITITGPKKRNKTIVFHDKSYPSLYTKSNSITIMRNEARIEHLTNIESVELKSRSQWKLLDSLANEFTIEGIIATGMECYPVARWSYNTQVPVTLFSYADVSLSNSLKLDMTSEKARSKLFPAHEALHLYTLLKASPAPSGTINDYSYRYFQEVADTDLEMAVKRYEERVTIKPLVNYKKF